MAKVWFKAKRYGWGWYPSTWEGWLAMCVYLVIFTFSEIFFVRRLELVHTPVFIFGYVIYVCVLTGFLIWVAYKKGEKSGWRWGGKKL